MPAIRPPIAGEIRVTIGVAAPLAAANLAQMAMQVTNAVMVGHLGAVPLAAAGLGNALNSTLLMTSMGLLTAVALAAPMMATLLLLSPLLGGLGYEAGLVAEIRSFLWAICWGVPGFLAAAVLRFQLTAAFRTRVVMVVPIMAVPLNLILNWVLIFGRWGLPALGSAGSGCATAIVQWLTLASFAAYMLVAKAAISPRIGRGVLRQIPGILRLGLPIAAMRGLEIGMFVMTGVLMGVIGADALGTHQLVFNVAGVAFMVPLGLAQAASVRVAYQLGQQKPGGAGRAGFVALVLGGLFMLGSAVVLWTVPRLLIGFYVDLADPGNQALIAIALQLFVIAALFQLFDGVQVIASGALRGYRDTTIPMVIAAIGYWAIGFAGGWLLAFPIGLGATGLWAGLAVGLAIVAVALTVRLYSQARRHLRDAVRTTLAPSESAAISG